MMFMNEWDIENAVNAFVLDDGPTPNLALLAQVVWHLADWANANSDGWHSWPKPCRAARKAQEILSEKQRQRYGRDVEDIDIATLKAACRPIKAFLTRQGVPHDEVFVDYLAVI